MIVCAVFKVKVELVPDDSGEFYLLPMQECIGYAVFDNGVIISPKIYPTYAEAEAWMRDEKDREDQRQSASPRMGM